MTEIDRLISAKKAPMVYQKILQELYLLEYNPNHKGTNYLAIAIFEIYENPLRYNDNLQKEIYPVISRITRKSINSIKCNIIRATENMVKYCSQDKLNEYFGGAKPTPKIVIDIILSKIM